MKGYKVFNPDWMCQNYQYEVGKTFEMDKPPVICRQGFHFCQKATDCFEYYSFDSKNKVAEVEALGDIETEGNKSCTNKIHIIREISWYEVLDLVNTGVGNTGRNNSGHRNSGNRNSGDRNSGHRNSGDWNSGDWNLSDYNSGCFNTEQNPLYFFDKPADITFDDWRDSDACYLLDQIDSIKWVEFEYMSEEEKKNHPKAKVTDGYLKKYDLKESANKWWDNLSDEEKQIIKDIPNFDADKFYKITGVKVD
ncbi:MAG TPA: pentapeptide repeat-containing protein [bacterium]|nr:pentapeptide repeat-containing protein [bacterium]